MGDPFAIELPRAIDAAEIEVEFQPLIDLLGGARGDAIVQMQPSAERRHSN